MDLSFVHNGLACATFVVTGLSAAGIAHVLWVKSHLSSRFDQPLDCGLNWRGRRVFGRNKMLRGLMLMPLASSAAFALLAAAISAHSAMAEVGLWPLSVTGYAALGFACGLAFMLGELPNSFLKRQLDVPPGGSPQQRWLRLVCGLLDRLDSTLGALITLSLLVPVSLPLWIWALLLGPLSHALFSAWLHAAGRTISAGEKT